MTRKSTPTPVEATEPTTTDEATPEEVEATEAEATTDEEATPVDPGTLAVQRFNEALEAADDDGLVPADETTRLVEAYQALPGRVAPAEFRAKVQSETVARAMKDIADPDRRLLTAMQSLFTTLDAADSTPATAPVDPTEVWVAKVQALTVLARDVRAEMPDDTYGTGTVRTVVTEALGDDLAKAFEAIANASPTVGELKLDEAWKQAAFGGRTPKPSRTKRSGGSRSSKGRDLANVPDGPVTYTYKDETFTAEVVGEKMVTEDGEEHTSPTGAATHLNGGTSTNGWTAWSRDGKSLAKVHDEATPDTDDDDEGDDE